VAICHRRKIIFIHIPKNGGTAFEKFLNVPAMGHPVWSAYAQTPYWDNYFKVAIVRNPYQRALSCYNYARMEKSYWHATSGVSIHGKHPEYDFLSTLTFYETLQYLDSSRHLFGVHWKPQVNWITGADKLIVVDKVIRLENIDYELKQLGFIEKMKKINQSAGDSHSISQREKAIINKVYKDDFDILGYEYET